jgi:hypothetical protein
VLIEITPIFVFCATFCSFSSDCYSQDLTTLLLAKKFSKKADFISIYILEAHATYGFKIQDICYKQPKTLKQRIKIAKAFVDEHKFEIQPWL